MQGRGFVYLLSILYHPYLVCILFGMPSQYLFIVLNAFYFLAYYISHVHLIGPLLLTHVYMCKCLLSWESSKQPLLSVMTKDNLAYKLVLQATKIKAVPSSSSHLFYLPPLTKGSGCPDLIQQGTDSFGSSANERFLHKEFLKWQMLIEGLETML